MRIAIAGPSCSGKSTLAGVLSASLGAERLCLDDFYLPGHPRRYVETGNGRMRSFEHPEAYDGAALLRRVAGMERPVVAEGFLLLLYPGAVDAFDLRVFVDLPWDEILSRRAARKGQNVAKVDASFAAVGRDEWELFGARQRDVEGTVVLDGRLPVADLLAQCRTYVARVAIEPGGDEPREPARLGLGEAGLSR